MIEPTFKQFKLTNDDEIICEVLEWDSPENSAILMRGALKIVESVHLHKGIRYYGFRPWMCFGEDPKILQTLNSSHIVCEVNPESSLLKLYVKAIIDIKEILKKPKKTYKVQDLELMMDEMSDEELQDYLDTVPVSEDDIFNPEVLRDSDNSKVVYLNPKNKTRH